jgi:hypothetical protein
MFFPPFDVLSGFHATVSRVSTTRCITCTVIPLKSSGYAQVLLERGTMVALAVVIAGLTSERVFAASAAGMTHTAEKTVPQGGRRGADSGESQNPYSHKGVIRPPPIGDVGIYTQAPNPNAACENEVIPPPASIDPR